MVKLGGVIGAVLAFVTVFIVGDHIDWASRQSDLVGTVVAVAAAVGGWLVGSRIVRRLGNRSPSAAAP